MTYYTFDAFGRFAGTSDEATPRSTTIAPDHLTPDYNWNGVNWVFAPNVPMQPVGGGGQTAVNPTDWFIDLGPFFDRFAAAKMAVLTSQDAAVKAILADLQVRKWIDLKRPETTSALAYLGSVIPSVTPALQSAILTSPVIESENMALRKVYFP